VEDTSQPALFSIIIPAYNEALRLPQSLRRLRDWLSRQPYPAEVIVVDDGSTDETSEVVRRAMDEWPTLRVHRIEHGGKGAAVRAGAGIAQGALVAFADADFSMPVDELQRLRMVALETGGIAIASREATGARRFGEPWYRHLMGRVFNRVVQWLALPGIQDTQCGFKCIPRAMALTLFAQQTIAGWGFDVELLVIARRHGFAIQEVPIPWHYMANSRVKLGRDTVNMIGDVLAIRANLHRGRYDALDAAYDAVDNQMIDVRNLHAR
jgi:glycosyltransferase involved in cell wall biosynthesis